MDYSFSEIFQLFVISITHLETDFYIMETIIKALQLYKMGDIYLRTAGLVGVLAVEMD